MALAQEDIPQFVDNLYALTGAGDWEAAAAMLTDDFIAVEADCLPMAGTYHGKYALNELYQKVFGMVDIVGLERTDLLVGPDCAIAVLKMQFADPALKPAELCELFRFRDGKCCEIKPYYLDAAPFHAACKAKAEAA